MSLIRSKWISSLAAVPAAVLSLSLLAGCGGGAEDAPDTFPVTGKVTQGGKPLADVKVDFVPSGGGLPSSGVTNAEGVYVLSRHTGDEGAIPGTYRVVLSEGTAPDMSAYQNPGEGPPAKESKIPEKWQSKETSPKSVEVKNEPNVVDIDVDAE